MPDEKWQLRVVQVVGDHIDRHPQVASTCRQGGENLGRLLNDPTGQQGRQAYPFDHPQDLAEDLINTVGVVEHGLFLNMVDKVIVGDPNGPRVMTNANK